MIIRLKNADFSASNVGKINIPGTNLNVGEGTTNPLLFKYTSTTGAGEFLGVDFITKENPSPFPIIRRLHKGGTEPYLYSYLTPDRSTVDFPITPKALSMAFWINKTAWERFIKEGYMHCMLQVYDGRWKSVEYGGDDPHPCLLEYSELSSKNEITKDITSTYMNVSVK